jgi:hypothetical protein
LGSDSNEINGKTIMHSNDLEPIKLTFVLEAQYILIEADWLLQITHAKKGVRRSGLERRPTSRPILPEDEPGLQASFFAKLTLEELRLRFLAPIKVITHVMAARFTQIDYDREMILVLTERGIPGKTEIYANDWESTGATQKRILRYNAML